MSAKIDHIHVVLPAAGGRSDERLTIGRTAELDHDAAPHPPPPAVRRRTRPSRRRCPPGEDMHPLSRCSVGRPWGALVLVSGPAAFTLVQLGGHRVVVSVDVRGRATASLGLAIPATCLPGEGGLFRVKADGAARPRSAHVVLCPVDLRVHVITCWTVSATGGRDAPDLLRPDGGRAEAPSRRPGTARSSASRCARPRLSRRQVARGRRRRSAMSPRSLLRGRGHLFRQCHPLLHLST